MQVNEQDKRTKRPTATLSPREMAAVNEARGEMPVAAWIREAILEKLAGNGIEVTDEARRPLPRRQNHSERQQREDEGQ